MNEITDYCPKANNKYRAIKTSVDGVVFASKAESRRYSQLKILEKKGFIMSLALQVSYELTPKLKRIDGKTERASHYVADFVYWCNERKRLIVEDVKGGKSTQLFIQKRKIMLEKYGITITEYRGENERILHKNRNTKACKKNALRLR